MAYLIPSWTVGGNVFLIFEFVLYPFIIFVDGSVGMETCGIVEQVAEKVSIDCLLTLQHG